MYITHCKLGRNKQLELTKYFVGGMTARTAANSAGIHRKGKAAEELVARLPCLEY